MDEQEFKVAYHLAIEEKLYNDISLLMQKWHRQLAPLFAKHYGIPEEEAFAFMEREYLYRGKVGIIFVSEDLIKFF